MILLLCVLQLAQKDDQNKLLEKSLDDKRTELITSQTRQRELEDKFELFNKAKQIQDKAMLDLEVGCVQ